MANSEPAQSEPAQPPVRNVARSLVRAAVSVWSEKGYQGASVQDIVRAAGVTKGAFYHYFDSKEDVFRLVHDEFADFEIERVREAIESGDTAAQKLAGILEAFAESTHFYLPEISLYFRDRPYISEATFAEIRRKRDILEEMILAVVVDGMEQGEFRPSTSPKVLTFGIIGMCAWIHEWFAVDGELTGREIGSLYADLVLQGLLEQPNPVQAS